MTDDSIKSPSTLEVSLPNTTPSPPPPPPTDPQTPTTTTTEAKTIDGLKIIHESPERAPKQKEQVPEQPMTREELLEQATKFLESPPIMNAPLKEKLEFLHTKGLTREETEALLTKLEEKGKDSEEANGKESVSSVPEEAKGKEIVQSTPSPVQPTPPSKPTPTQQAPIVTYPEFLAPAPPPPPPPLLTAKTLGKAIYFASGAAATIYGANKFVFTPMYDALTAARLDLSSTALTNLRELNTRLQLLIPEPKPRSLRDDSDSDSDVSDPTEMFHVDAQTQTSPSLDSFPLDDDVALGPESKLERLGRQLETLVESHSDGTDNELSFALVDLTSYLETLAYELPVVGMYASPYSEYSLRKEKDKDDPIAKVKAEIRSVKGMLLNSKNFPASR